MSNNNCYNNVKYTGIERDS